MFAPSSSESARSSAMSTPLRPYPKLRRFRIPLDRGNIRPGVAVIGRGRLRRRPDISPLYSSSFRCFSTSSSALRTRRARSCCCGAVRAEGRTISQSLLPLLETADVAALPELGRDLARYASEATTVKLLLQPAGARNGTKGFYYVASWPPVAPSNLEAERETLAKPGRARLVSRRIAAARCRSP